MRAEPSEPSPAGAPDPDGSERSTSPPAMAASTSDITPAAREDGQRPPAPPPPLARAGTTADAQPAGEAAAPSRATRRHPRHRLSEEPPARIVLPHRQTIFVTISDISSGGCCVRRKGRLELTSGDAVHLDIWTHTIEMKLSIHARICWTSHDEDTSRAGLRFVETNHRLLRQLEAYVEHFQNPRQADRPVAYFPGGPRPDGPDSSRDPRPAPVAAASAAGRQRRAPTAAARPGRPPELAAVPRPAPLTSLDLQRRMRPAHRQEVARIAEETGIHIHTLYGWLRTLQLEGPVQAGGSRDPEAWSATDKVSALLNVAGMSSSERQAFCRRHNLSEEQLNRWRQAALQANEKPLLILRAEEELQRLRVRDQREIRRLQKELRRQERSVAISDELLQVVRKLQRLWEQADLD